MLHRDVVNTVLDGKKPPYVPWAMFFTSEAYEKLQHHFGPAVEEQLDNHVAFYRMPCFVGSDETCVRDEFGVVWDRSSDKDIGNVRGQILPEPDLSNLKFPDPFPDGTSEKIQAWTRKHAEQYRVFAVDFTLYERAWTLRGIESILMDFYENPEFLHDLLSAIADWTVARVSRALEHDFDAAYFGDDWGQQEGLIMGPKLWKEFIQPRLRTIYSAVKGKGARLFIHSCGDVDGLFDELAGMGVDCFNPFQPEVMDVHALLDQYRGRLTFHGGLSTQKTLPYGTQDDVRRETKALLDHGAAGSYIFAPAHAVEGDVSLENMLVFIEAVKAQQGYRDIRRQRGLPVPSPSA